MSEAAPDPRLNAWRDDLAADCLRGQVDAPRFAKGEPAQVTAELAPLRRAPAPDAALDTQALRGETVTVFDERDGWAWVQLDRDRYVGYLPADALSRGIVPVTHRIAALRTYVFPQPDIKTPPVALLSMNAGIAVTAEQGKFLELAGRGFVFAAHAMPQDRHASDFVTVAERFVGTPYLWGGRSSLGIDCSGLVQVALEACGIACPRDSNMQEKAVGAALGDCDPARLQRGDLLFWPGHVAIVAAPDRLLHANAHHMETVSEPLAPALARIAQSAGPVRSVRRIGVT